METSDPGRGGEEKFPYYALGWKEESGWLFRKDRETEKRVPENP